MIEKAHPNHLSRADELITTPLGRQGWHARLALERHRRATPYIAQARALKFAASQAKHSIDLERMSEIKAALMPVSDVNFVEELVYRFLINGGEALDGSMRNVGDILAQRSWQGR